MRIIDCAQHSDEWLKVRCGLPTASRFSEIISPAKGAYSASTKGLIGSLIEETLPGYVPFNSSEWMEWGSEQEPNAVRQYEFETNNVVTEVGFVFPDDRDDVGCSPDRLVNDGASDGLLEVKCPKPKTLVGYHLDGGLPLAYKCQVQGQLWVTGLEWCDFYAWHPEVKPFLVRVERDPAFCEKLEICIDKFCREYQSARQSLLV